MTLESSGEQLVCNTTYIDRIELALSILASLSHERDYQYKLDRLEAIRVSGIGIQPDQTQKMTIYAQTAVQACHGFSKPQEIEALLGVLESVRLYYERVRSPEIAEAFNMMLGQLARETRSHNLFQRELDFLSEATSVAIDFPQPHFGIAANTVRELCDAFERYVKARELALAVEAQELTLEIIQAADAYPHEQTRRLYCGPLIDSVCRAYIDGWDLMMPNLPTIASYLSSAPSVPWDQLIGAIIQPFSYYFSEGMKALGSGDPERARRCVEILKFYSAYDPSTYDYSQLIRLISEKLKSED